MSFFHGTCVLNLKTIVCTFQTYHKQTMLGFIYSFFVTLFSTLFTNKAEEERIAKEERRVELERQAEEFNRNAPKHLATEKNGEYHCSCGLALETETMYKHHYEEATTRNKKNEPDETGWPAHQFNTVPYIENAQKAIVARGDLNHGMFMRVDLKNNVDLKQVGQVLGSVITLRDGILKEVDDVDNKSRLVALVALSPELWQRFASERKTVHVPHDLYSFETKKAKGTDKVLFPATGGDVFIMIKSLRADLCYELSKVFLDELADKVQDFERYTTFGYKGVPMAAKDLSGFMDGTRNPDHLLRALIDEVLIFPEDDTHVHERSSHVGGSYMYAGRFVHDLKAIREMSQDDRNQIIGRDYDVVAPHRGFDRRPENPRLKCPHARSHSNRSHASMYRQAMPYVSNKEEGLYFVCFARFLSEIDTALNRMAGHYEQEDDSTDYLFKMTQCVSSQYFYVPSVHELKALATDEIVTSSNTIQENIKRQTEKKTSLANKHRPIIVNFEYCTNCGYVTIFKEKKKLLELLSDDIIVVGNPVFPRLSAFEVTAEDGTVLWTKLNHESGDGGNNYPHVFPTNQQMVDIMREKYGDRINADTEHILQDLKNWSIHKDHGTQHGVW
jgi:Dyp-type peroxidase family